MWNINKIRKFNIEWTDFVWFVQKFLARDKGAVSYRRHETGDQIIQCN